MPPRSGLAPPCRSPTSSAGGRTRRRSSPTGVRSSRRRRFATARRSAGTWRPPRRSATRRRCSWRSMRWCTSPAAQGAAPSPSPVSSPAIGAPCSSPARSSLRSKCPKPFPQHLRFYKVAKRRLDDISTVAAAMALDRDAGGRVRRARFAFGGVAATPVRAVEAEDAATGQPWTASTVERVQRALERTLAPHQRRARLGGLPQAGGLQPGREVLSRSRGHEHRGPAGSARERAGSRDRRGALHRRPRRALSQSAARVAGAGAARARARHRTRHRARARDARRRHAC